MAMIGIGKTAVDVRIQHWLDGKVYKMVVKDSVKIDRTPNAPSVLTCTLLRDKVAVEEEDIITVTIDGGHNCFCGRVLKTSDEDDWSEVTAYDQLFDLQINKRRFIYEDATASDVYRRIIEDNELKAVVDEQIMDTGYKIPYRIESNTTYLDMMQTALDLTYENTGHKFFIWDDFGSMSLHSEEWLAEQPYIQITPRFIEGYKYEKDGTQRYTAVRIENEVKNDPAKGEVEELPEDWDWDDVTDVDPDLDVGGGDDGDGGLGEDWDWGDIPGFGGGGDDEESEREEFEKEKAREFVVYTARNEDAIEKFGFREYYGTLEEGENGDHKAKQLLKENEDAKRTLTLTGVQGDIQVRGGTPVLVDFFSKDRQEFIRGWFSTESVTHVIEHGLHTMDLTLTCILMLDDWSTDEPDYTFRRPEWDQPPIEAEEEIDEFGNN